MVTKNCKECKGNSEDLDDAQLFSPAMKTENIEFELSNQCIFSNLLFSCPADTYNTGFDFWKINYRHVHLLTKELYQSDLPIGTFYGWNFYWSNLPVLLFFFKFLSVVLFLVEFSPWQNDSIFDG